MSICQHIHKKQVEKVFKINKHILFQTFLLLIKTVNAYIEECHFSDCKGFLNNNKILDLNSRKYLSNGKTYYI